MVVQGPPFRALPVPPCFHEGREGCPCPVTGSGQQDPQLSRARAQLCDHRDLVPRAPQPVGASGQLGKEQALHCAEKLFSQYGVRLGECGGMSLTNEHAQSMLACLSSF